MRGIKLEVLQSLIILLTLNSRPRVTKVYIVGDETSCNHIFRTIEWLILYRCIQHTYMYIILIYIYIYIHDYTCIISPLVIKIAMENHHAIKYGKPSISMGHRKTMAM